MVMASPICRMRVSALVSVGLFCRRANLRDYVSVSGRWTLPTVVGARVCTFHRGECRALSVSHDCVQIANSIALADDPLHSDMTHAEQRTVRSALVPLVMQHCVSFTPNKTDMFIAFQALRYPLVLAKDSRNGHISRVRKCPESDRYATFAPAHGPFRSKVLGDRSLPSLRRA